MARKAARDSGHNLPFFAHLGSWPCARRTQVFQAFLVPPHREATVPMEPGRRVFDDPPHGGARKR